jgi:hypothetical protein
MERGMARMVSRGIFFFVLVSMLVPIETMAAREIPDDTLAYPVQINSTNCITDLPHFGSGFFLNTGKSLYLVTARHVVFGDIKGIFVPNTPLLCKEATLIVYSKDPKEKQQNIINLNFEALNKNGHIKPHKVHDVAAIYM